MKNKKVLALAVILSLTLLLLVACGSNDAASTDAENTDAQQTETEQVESTDLASGYSPKPQPADHIDYWESGGSTSDACLKCHAAEGEESVGREMPLTHFIEDDGELELDPSRQVCITCHVPSAESDASETAADEE